MALQLWQEAIKDNPGTLVTFINMLIASRPIADARRNFNTSPDSFVVFDELTPEFEALILAMSGRPSINAGSDAADPEFQRCWSDLSILWMLLRPFYQGKNVLSCDAGLALRIQEQLLLHTSDPVPEPEPEP